MRFSLRSWKSFKPFLIKYSLTILGYSILKFLIWLTISSRLQDVENFLFDEIPYETFYEIFRFILLIDLDDRSDELSWSIFWFLLLKLYKYVLFAKESFKFLPVNPISPNYRYSSFGYGLLIPFYYSKFYIC